MLANLKLGIARVMTPLPPKSELKHILERACVLTTIPFSTQRIFVGVLLFRTELLVPNVFSELAER